MAVSTEALHPAPDASSFYAASVLEQVGTGKSRWSRPQCIHLVLSHRDCTTKSPRSMCLLTQYSGTFGRGCEDGK